MVLTEMGKVRQGGKKGSGHRLKKGQRPRRASTGELLLPRRCQTAAAVVTAQCFRQRRSSWHQPGAQCHG